MVVGVVEDVVADDEGEVEQDGGEMERMNGGKRMEGRERQAWLFFGGVSVYRLPRALAGSVTSSAKPSSSSRWSITGNHPR